MSAEQASKKQDYACSLISYFQRGIKKINTNLNFVTNFSNRKRRNRL